MKRMTLNAVQCNECKEIITSHFRHDFNGCSCGSTFIDGGLDYQRVGYGKAGYTDVSEYEDVDEEVDE
jgi:hypothetical protein